MGNCSSGGGSKVRFSTDRVRDDWVELLAKLETDGDLGTDALCSQTVRLDKVLNTGEKANKTDLFYLHRGRRFIAANREVVVGGNTYMWSWVFTKALIFLIINLFLTAHFLSSSLLTPPTAGIDLLVEDLEYIGWNDGRIKRQFHNFELASDREMLHVTETLPQVLCHGPHFLLNDSPRYCERALVQRPIGHLQHAGIDGM